MPLLGSGVTKDRGVDSETDKRKCAYIKGKSDVVKVHLALQWVLED